MEQQVADRACIGGATEETGCELLARFDVEAAELQAFGAIAQDLDGFRSDDRAALA